MEKFNIIKEDIKKDDVYDKNINFLIGSGAEAALNERPSGYADRLGS